MASRFVSTGPVRFGDGSPAMQRAEFLGEQAHAFEEFVELRFAVHQQLLMGDYLWDFRGEDKVWRRALVPVGDRLCAGSSVIGAVNFYGVELRCVIREKVARLRSGWVEGNLPAVRGEGRSAKQKAGLDVRSLDD